MRFHLWLWTVRGWFSSARASGRRLFRLITLSRLPPVQLLPVEHFKSPEAAKALAEKVARMELSRRGSLKLIEDRISRYEPGFLNPDGSPVDAADVPDFSVIVGDDTGKWLGDFRTWPAREFRQAIQDKIAHRLQWIDAALRAR
ncbi:hypothetical protein KRZ98_05225 [Sphingobium sp. AS12]|uniref:hypothetical protein n=1 Tax=Sphingobium sp. AS12 TaxID=2849495 RepID=UPI001C317FD2|nr:hypothetical protein [Sphingobium sp. AS12]MBV2147687.1 hypothetical protein [Sphingobium sp. AS12]